MVDEGEENGRGSEMAYSDYFSFETLMTLIDGFERFGTGRRRKHFKTERIAVSFAKYLDILQNFESHLYFFNSYKM